MEVMWLLLPSAVASFVVLSSLCISYGYTYMSVTWIWWDTDPTELPSLGEVSEVLLTEVSDLGSD